MRELILNFAVFVDVLYQCQKTKAKNLRVSKTVIIEEIIKSFCDNDIKNISNLGLKNTDGLRDMKQSTAFLKEKLEEKYYNEKYLKTNLDSLLDRLLVEDIKTHFLSLINIEDGILIDEKAVLTNYTFEDSKIFIFEVLKFTLLNTDNSLLRQFSTTTEQYNCYRKKISEYEKNLIKQEIPNNQPDNGPLSNFRLAKKAIKAFNSSIKSMLLWYYIDFRNRLKDKEGNLEFRIGRRHLSEDDYITSTLRAEKVWDNLSFELKEDVEYVVIYKKYLRKFSIFRFFRTILLLFLLNSCSTNRDKEYVNSCAYYISESSVRYNGAIFQNYSDYEKYDIPELTPKNYENIFINEFTNANGKKELMVIIVNSGDFANYLSYIIKDEKNIINIEKKTIDIETINIYWTNNDRKYVRFDEYQYKQIDNSDFDLDENELLYKYDKNVSKNTAQTNETPEDIRSSLIIVNSNNFYEGFLCYTKNNEIKSKERIFINEKSLKKLDENVDNSSSSVD